jgi:hypothetical protein
MPDLPKSRVLPRKSRPAARPPGEWGKFARPGAAGRPRPPGGVGGAGNGRANRTSRTARAAARNNGGEFGETH